MWMNPRLRWIWLALNLCGMGAYLWLASALWVKPGTEGEPGGPGDAFYWLFLLVPILGSFLILDLATLFVILFQRRGFALKVALAWWAATAVLWISVVAFDHHKAFRVISPEYSCLTPRSTRTPPARAASPSQLLATSAPFVASVQAGLVSSIR
jgi:hypothetical protein